MKLNKLRVFDIKPNSINGGSMRYFICHNDSKYMNNQKIIFSILNQEKKLKLDSIKTYYNFFKKINKVKIKLRDLLKAITNKKLTIHGYGASTKGNVLLQYFGLTNKFIPYIADRNPQKFNTFTPGTKIKIISEKFSRKMNPDYYLVLPWHFKDEILKRETKIRKKGTKFIFPLPDLKIL